MRSREAVALYRDRKLASGYPGHEARSVHEFLTIQSEHTGIDEIMRCIGRATALPAGSKSVAVVGCGPKPQALKELREAGYDSIGIEPVRGFVEAAREYMGDPDSIVSGGAESLPLVDGSQAVVVLASVLEHVDSPSRSLSEAWRVLAPGGVAYVQTTNARRISLTGNCGEFNLPFFNLFPATLKEAFVHEQLHYRPGLSNWAQRPAVHWFTYADLCRRGREAGFHRFYTKFDLLHPDDPSVSGSALRRLLVNRLRYNPWLRSLALLQFGDSIFMLKRATA